VLIAAHAHAATLRSQAPLLEFLARTEPPQIEVDLPAKPEQAVTIIVGGVEVYLPLAGMIDIAQELARIDAEIASARQDIARSQQMLANEQFTSRAKPEIVQREREKLAGHEERLAKLQARRQELE
jgi:valyl-tRNA synthetase